MLTCTTCQRVRVTGRALELGRNFLGISCFFVFLVAGLTACRGALFLFVLFFGLLLIVIRVGFSALTSTH